MADTAPTGTITLVFTDIQDSTRMWEELGDAFRPLLDRHNEIVRGLIEKWDGYEVKSHGDSFMVAFQRGTDAVQFALDVQRDLAQQKWDKGEELLVRIGMHTGEPFLGYDPAGRPDYFGPVVNRAARISASGHGGQTILSAGTKDIVDGALTADIELINMGTHLLRGLEQAEQIYQVRHPDIAGRRFPPLKTQETLKTNLPEPRTSFVGRIQELTDLRKMLRRRETRLLTLIGFGGMGKTRTALQLAELCAYDYQDGVWWIEAEEATTGEALIQRIAYQMRIHLQPQPSVKEQVCAYLADQELLMVLDNTEQIPDVGKVVNELLNVAPKAKFVVTTRRALEISHELLVEIPPLPQHDAEMLFVERAQTRRADFQRNADNAADIAALVCQLECVPLAIELAASRIVGMTPREIQNRLTERFRLLQTRAPDLPARQRALRGAIDWSYDLLTEDDKALFAQLAVFAGGFTLDDTEAVCDAFDVFEGVMELRRHSLTRAETDPGTQATRYLMLESVREYAAEKLSEMPDEGQEFRKRHAEHFVQFAEKRVARMKTRDEMKALDELGPTYPNLLSAHSWCRQNGEDEIAARLSIPIYHILYRRGFLAEARRVLETGLEAAEMAFDDVRKVEASLLLYLAGIVYDMGDTDEARERAEASLALRRELGDAAGTAEALNLMGILAMDAQESEDARRLLDEALALVPRDHERRGRVLHNLARLTNKGGNPGEARRLYQEALKHRQRAGDARGEAETLGNLGVLAYNAEDYAEARRLYHSSLDLLRRLRDRQWIAVMLYNLGELAELDLNLEAGAAEGLNKDLETAVILYTHSERIFREIQSAMVVAPAEKLEALQEKCRPELWNRLQNLALEKTWEQII